MTAALRAHLRAYPPGTDGLLFTTPQGNVLNPANWRQRIWRPLIRSAPGIPPGTTFHRLRHAYASLLGDAGLPDHEIQRRLGHPSRRDPLVPSSLPRLRGQPGHPRRHRRRFHGRGNRPRAGNCLLILLTEKLTSPKPGSRQE